MTNTFNRATGTKPKATGDTNARRHCRELSEIKLVAQQTQEERQLVPPSGPDKGLGRHHDRARDSTQARLGTGGWRSLPSSRDNATLAALGGSPASPARRQVDRGMELYPPA
ncbi:hypothetical protein CSOJ01_12250 [Colletotrichum sojae]|uniref:Uncharacterized protein n=1 Tax=Colletotrichum sojae TaxID=2175907 RepID=A0A8H6IVB7_9PEZI|nr:hypothetical protein CSOJ01_12250 [Colletotrichum sojae]